jgi:hypothetical protein
MVLLPFVLVIYTVFTPTTNLETMTGPFIISMLIQWTGILILIKRTRNHLRPLPTTRVGPGILVDNHKLVRFRETPVN